MCLLILERKEGVRGSRGRGEVKRERVGERNINWLPPVHTLTGD